VVELRWWRWGGGVRVRQQEGEKEGGSGRERDEGGRVGNGKARKEKKGKPER
jgi:hypothetical protein